MTRNLVGRTFALFVVSTVVAAGCGKSGNNGGNGGAGAAGAGGHSSHSTVHGSGAGGPIGSGGSGAGSTTNASGSGGHGGASTSSSGTSTSSSTGMSSSSTGGAPPTAGDSVLMHHKNPNRDGMYVEAALTKAAVATLHVDASFAAATTDSGLVYAQPLFVDGGGVGPDLVIIATEADNVHAFDASDGHVVWSKNVGTPAPKSTFGCGNIDPVGITGTPVIDFASRRIFFSAAILKAGLPSHQIFALSIDTGNVVAGYPIVVASAITGGTTFDPTVHGQRGALAIAGGKLYVPYGGLYGDCGTYHGWITSVSLADPTPFEAWPTTARGGGVWSMGGVSADDTHVYMTTGNTFSATDWGGGEGVLAFPIASSIKSGPADYFAPKNWKSLDDGDTDLGTAPIPFDLAGSTPSHLAVAFGKDGYGYLLDRTALGHVSNAIGGPGSCAAGSTCGSLQVASNQIISAPVLYTTATATYVSLKGNGSHCTGGTSGALTTVKVVAGSPPKLASSWCAKAGAGTPIVTTSDGHADAIVWQTGADGDSHLHAFDGDTGAAIAFTASNTSFNTVRYATLIAAKGRLFIAANDGGGHATVVALKP